MSLRIHSASTLDEAATWLSEETTETWNVRAVLEGLLRGWRYRGVNAVRLLPISLEMVVPPGSIMRDSILTEQTHVTDRPQTLIAGGAALEKLLHDLLQYGEATDVSLNSNSGQRWLCTSPLRPEHVRLPAGVIDTLVPEFDRFVKSDLAVQVLELASLAKDAPVADNASDALVVKHKSKGPTWWDVSSAYIVKIMQGGQYATCKELYRALEEKAGPNSPFDKGTGTVHGSLFVREIRQSLSLKTLQNNWKMLCELAQK